MPGKTRLKKDRKKNAAQKKMEKILRVEPETDKEGNWSEDQQEKSYYYDDAHGYEIFNPDEDDNETERSDEK